MQKLKLNLSRLGRGSLGGDREWRLKIVSFKAFPESC